MKNPSTGAVHCHAEEQKSTNLVSSQRQVIWVINKGVFEVSCHLIQAPVALHTQEVDDKPYPGAVDEGNDNQGDRECVEDEHNEHHLSPGEWERSICENSAWQQQQRYLSKILVRHLKCQNYTCWP